MTLAEALQARSDLNTKISQLEYRLQNNALIQEGEKPNEDPQELLNELNQSVAELEALTAKINLTNTKTMVDGLSLTELMAKRDCLKLKIRIYKSFTDSASTQIARTTRSEIKTLPTVSVKQLQKQIDSLSKELRVLDNQIQKTNWSTEL